MSEAIKNCDNLIRKCKWSWSHVDNKFYNDARYDFQWKKIFFEIRHSTERAIESVKVVSVM